MIDAPWEAAEIASLLTTYISGIEENLKAPMLAAAAHLAERVEDVYDRLEPIMGAAFEAIDVNLPGE